MRRAEVAGLTLKRCAIIAGPVMSSGMYGETQF
jgi:hypothetical protein